MRRFYAIFLGLAACSQPPVPAPFAQSAAFHQMSRNVQALVERDLSDTGSLDAAVAVHSAQGFEIRVLRHPDAPDAPWSVVCASTPIPGEEIVGLHVVGEPHAELLLLLSRAEDPDDTVQNGLLIDPRAHCSVLWQAQMRWPKPAAALLSREPYPRGVALSDDGLGFDYLERPEFIMLRAGGGDVAVLARYVSQVFHVSQRAIHQATQRVNALRRREVTLQWQELADPPPAARALPELADQDDETFFTAGGVDLGHVALDAKEPVIIVEVHHGCDDGPADMTLVDVSGRRANFTAGTVPKSASFVAAAGRRPTESPHRAQDVMALQTPQTHLELGIESRSPDHCLREISAYGW